MLQNEQQPENAVEENGKIFRQWDCCQEDEEGIESGDKPRDYTDWVREEMLA